jgi:lipopolysaccharide export system permease protein
MKIPGMSLLAGYLSGLLLSRVILMLVGLTALILGLDLMVNAGSLMRSHGGLEALGRYAALRTPIIVSDMIKIASLLAGLLTFAGLIRHGELAAMWIAGLSQLGLFRRLLSIGLLLGALQFAVDDLAVPDSVDALYAWGVGEYEKPRETGTEGGITWIHVGNDILRVPTENIRGDSLVDFSIFERNAEGDLLGRLDVASAHYAAGRWQLRDITITGVDGSAPRHEATRDWLIALDPESLRHLAAHPRYLPFDQIRRFAAGDGQGTWAPYLYQTWLYEKLTTCLIPLLMLLLSAALAQQTQRAGRLELLFLGGAAIGFAFFIFNGISLAMGEVGLLPPLLASAAPILAFAAIAGSVIYWNELKKRPR